MDKKKVCTACKINKAIDFFIGINGRECVTCDECRRLAYVRKSYNKKYVKWNKVHWEHDDGGRHIRMLEENVKGINRHFGHPNSMADFI